MQMNKCMIHSALRLLIPLDQQQKALEVLRSISMRTRYEPNCIYSRLYRDVEEDRAILLEECWADQEDMLNHLRSDSYRMVLLVAEMAEEKPDVRFDTISGTSGIETIEAARKSESIVPCNRRLI